MFAFGWTSIPCRSKLESKKVESSMAIEIINPRRVLVTLSYDKKRTGFQVDKLLQSFLRRRGWTLLRVGKNYVAMMPPDGLKPPFVFNVEIPTREQVLAIAQEKHDIRQQWADMLGEWPAIYLPPQKMTWKQIDPFTGETVSEQKRAGLIGAKFHVGVRLFWDAEVFLQNGNASYHESASQQIDLQTVEFVSPEEIQLTAPLIEGAACRITVNAYERNLNARRLCLKAHGTNCCICGFNFGKIYGAEAEGYIHVHHAKPLSEIQSDYEVDPIKDLIPVCPNCHAVLHLNGRCRTVEEVKRLIGHKRQKQSGTKDENPVNNKAKTG